MKKFCISIIMILGILSIATINVSAAEAQVNIGIVGEVKKGSDIDVVVNLQKMTNLYAASMEYTYDNSLLRIESIEVSSNVNNGSIHEAYNETASGGNRARYGYTNLGDTQGFNGDTNFLIIKAKVLKDGDLPLNKENLKVKLVKNQGTITEMLCDVNYPKESWEAVKAPTGETTYTSIAAKPNSISPNALNEDKTSEVTQESKSSEVISEDKVSKVTLWEKILKVIGVNKTSEDTDKIQVTEEEKSDVPEEVKSDTGEIEATEKEKSDATEEASSPIASNNDSQIEENDDKDETSNYWIIGIIVIALIAGGGFLRVTGLSRKISNLGEKKM